MPLVIFVIFPFLFVHPTNYYIFGKFPSNVTNCYIFITLPFSFCMPLIPTFSSHYLFDLCIPLITTFLSPNWGVGKKFWLKKKCKFVVMVRQVCDLGIGITWVQVSRLPMPHPDNDKWKCTMFTNKFYVSAHHIDKIVQVNAFTGWITQY